MIQLTIDANEASKANESSFDPIPEGEYTVTCIKIEDKFTKDQTGKYLSCQFEVVDHPEYSKKKLFTNFNYQNKSIETVKITKRQLYAWVLQSGLAKDGDQFEFVPHNMIGTTIKVKVTVEKRNSWTDPATGKVYPEKLENKMTILPPGSSSIPQTEKAVDKTASWT